ncbi:MAG: UDP-N-acetylmuramoyl-L-alanyl-D-glutamate--2,6-diaminopimelate ligase [Bacteroidetes bacterium]|nr:UDP-N-acetylmuramoyl-L-alanyl-D-glutamate--2,6-diaminopimelate ligase [Bacteroidota bacterium]
MKILQDILYKTSILQIQGKATVAVQQLIIDSRMVQPGTCFIAIKGVHTDGHQHISQAIEAGAVAVVCEQLPETLQDEITYIQVRNSAEAAGYMAHAFFGNVSNQLKIVGVTGTNGKTTVATLLYQLFSSLGYQCGLISTVANRIGSETLVATHTTPDAIQLNTLLSQMHAAGCTHVFMECSSHAIHQHRIAGIQFTGAIFTNITHDHLDYHQTFDAYIKAKKGFFDRIGSDAFALTNADDARGTVMLQNTKAKKYTYGLKNISDFKGKMLENNLEGLQLSIEHHQVHFRLIGAFNAYNLLAVYAAAVLMGENKELVLSTLSNLSGAQGRFETIRSNKKELLGIIDYAHTPDALKNVLSTIQQLKQQQEQLITIVGCGGDRDKTKRPLMGSVACALSDRVIFTSDNPRSENPESILTDMQAELSSAERKKLLVIEDRKQAIETAVKIAGCRDIILLAGKGHEKYQEIKGVKYPFDDKSVLSEIFAQMDTSFMTDK